MFKFWHLFYRLKPETASNWSNSVASHNTKKHWDWEIHSKGPTKYGNTLHPNDISEFQKNNTPCTWRCNKWVVINEQRLNKSKMKRIKKRVMKTLDKIEGRESAIKDWQPNGSAIKHPLVHPNVEPAPDKEGLPDFTNLSGLKLMLQVSDILPKIEK